MGKIINFKSRKNEKLKVECERLQKECKLFESLIRYRHYHYFLDNQLIISGWIPCGSIPINEKYFEKRNKTLSYIGWSKIREERSNMWILKNLALLFTEETKN